MLDKKYLKIFGLSEKENAILKALEEGSASPTSLAGAVELPRTTVAFLLNKLKKRGLVEKIKVGRRFQWKAAAKTDIAHTLRRLSNRLDPGTALFEITKGERQSEIEIYRGKERMKDALQKVLEVRKGRRVYGLQGNRSIGKSLEKIEWDFILEYQNTLKKKGIIMEGIAGESALKIFEKLTKEQLESHLGRPGVCYLAPDEFFDFNLDIMVFQNIVMTINYDEETILLIKDSMIQEAMQKFISFMESCSRKIDLNAYLRDLIEEKEK